MARERANRDDTRSDTRISVGFAAAPAARSGGFEARTRPIDGRDTNRNVNRNTNRPTK
ncbi:hypothetical protein ZOD2009_13431 [Haladaptatus paucihalophilus DX253]|uniref:Uncharacterized protein n=1 Tax=Haladaptatus paucihalophilus DX253 TaxID=797209 RepID=E7QV50_HALPU|nr:hypothetical protein [Haladaptatus sp. T7]EFW91568.1 hypothetical protein ZOD2009_13431 [Haladaptatus paucihalophilus DX253]